MAQGHIRKRGATWTFVQHLLDPATGKGKYKWTGGFRTKAEAQRALRQALLVVESGQYIEPSRLTYADFVTTIWLPQLRTELEGSTVESYARNMRVHVLPRLGGVRLQKLSALQLNSLYQDLRQSEPDRVRPKGAHDQLVYGRIAALRSEGTSYGTIAELINTEFPTERLTKDAVAAICRRQREQAKVARAPLSARTVQYIHTIISRSLKDATKLRLVHENVAGNATPPRSSKARQERLLWTAEQTRGFLSWARDTDHRLWPAWAFVATSGDRRGANLGLRWSDIDFDNGTARLVWTVTCVDHQVVVKAYGKTGQNHEIILDDGTLRMLKWWRARQNEERLILGGGHGCDSVEPGCQLSGYHARGLVFARPDGDYLHPERFSREFQRAQDRFNRANPDAQLPRITLHALRHGWATVALEAGVPMKVVQDRLNHASERITADIYTHVRAPIRSDAAQRVADLVLPPLDDR